MVTQLCLCGACIVHRCVRERGREREREKRKEKKKSEKGITPTFVCTQAFLG